MEGLVVRGVRRVEITQAEADQSLADKRRRVGRGHWHAEPHAHNQVERRPVRVGGCVEVVPGEPTHLDPRGVEAETDQRLSDRLGRKWARFALRLVRDVNAAVTHVAHCKLPGLCEVWLERVRLKTLSRHDAWKTWGNRVRPGRHGVRVDLIGHRCPVQRPADRLPELRVAREEPSEVEQECPFDRRRLDPEAAGADRLAAADPVLLRHCRTMPWRQAPEVELARLGLLEARLRIELHIQLDPVDVAPARAGVVRVPDDVRLLVGRVVRPRVRAGSREVADLLDPDRLPGERELRRGGLEERHRQDRQQARIGADELDREAQAAGMDTADRVRAPSGVPQRADDVEAPLVDDVRPAR